MNSFVLRSPAKLNLFLKVINKRPDGYHNLVTLFERIDLCDDIHFCLNKKGLIRIFCNHPDVPKGPKNIVYKAAKILKEDFAVKEGVDIKIVKRIPVAAGLGGGSSNAAKTLLGLNRLWGLSLPKSILFDYAKALGSDIPFFLEDCSFALGTGRGDKLRQLDLKVKFQHILVVPRLKVLTREIFGAFRGAGLPIRQAGTKVLTNKGDDVNILIRALRKNDLSQIGLLLTNDLETTLVRFHPNLIKLKYIIKEYGALNASFSGSGPAAFGLVASDVQAKTLKAFLSRQYSRVFIVRTL